MEPISTSTAFTKWFWMMVLALGGGTSMPLGVPPLPEDPVLARIAPEECLAYFSSAGTAAADPKSSNQTEQLLAEPEVRALAAEVERLIRSGVVQAAKRQGAEEQALAEDGLMLLQHLLVRPMAIYVSQVKLDRGSQPGIRAGLVVNLGDEVGPLKAALLRYWSVIERDRQTEAKVEADSFSFNVGSRDFRVTWAIKGQHLFVAVGPGEWESLRKRANADRPQWLSSLRQQLPVERTATVGMLNVKALVSTLRPLIGTQLDGVLESTGLSAVSQVGVVSGLDRTGFVSRARMTLDREPRGLLQLTVQPPLTAADLAVIPRDATFAMAHKCALDKTLAEILAVVGKLDPRAAESFRSGVDRAEKDLGLKLVDDVLRPLGDSWRLFDSPSEGGILTGATLSVSLKDPAKAAATHRKLLAIAKSGLDRHPAGKRGPKIGTFTFAGQEIYYFVGAHEADFPFTPAWCLTDTELLVALFPEALKAYLSRGAEFQSLAQSPEVAESLKGEGDALALAYVDTQRLFDLLYPMLPIIVQLATPALNREGLDVNVGAWPSAKAIRAHLRPSVTVVRRVEAGIEITSRGTVPAAGLVSAAPLVLVPTLSFRQAQAKRVQAAAMQDVFAARDAALRTHSMNNLKQIGLAMHNYHDLHQTLPPAYRAENSGRPLLSWRVLILPYIDQQALYKEFHLDEPWDSQHNKKLIERIPAVYRSPGSKAAPGSTNYLTIRGPDTVFPGKDGVSFRQITDGTSNTILVVEASDEKAVVWTKPDDFEYNAADPQAGLVGLRSQGFLTAICDGSVRLIAPSIDKETLTRLILRNDGKPVPPKF
jgi:hypothetical protein